MVRAGNAELIRLSHHRVGRRSNRMSVRIVLLFLVVGLLPLFINSATSLFSMKASLQHVASVNLFSVGQRVGQEIDSHLNGAWETVASLAGDRVIVDQGVSLDDKEAELKRVAYLSRSLDDVTLGDLKGRVLASANYRFRGDWSTKPWIQEAESGSPAFSDVHTVTDPNEEVIVIASPVVNTDGSVVGVLAGQIRMTDIWRITDGIRIGDSGYIVLLNKRGDVIAHPDKSRVWEKFSPSSPAQLAENPQSLQFFDDAGVPMVASLVPLSKLGPWDNVGWSVVVVEPESEAFAIMTATINQTLWTVALALAILVITALLLSRSITGPVIALAEGTRRLMRGELGYRVEMDRGDELGALARSFNEMSATIGQQRDDLEESYKATIEAIATALDLRDHETNNHARRVTFLAMAIARRLNMSDSDLANFEKGALLHDVGKIGVPDGYLRKPGPLTAAEWAEMKRHPEYGYRVLARIPFLADALPVILHHHERYDGRGYPGGLAGKDIPLAARIFAAADTYDAITSDRPYRAGSPTSAAVAEITACSGTQFDPAVVRAFVDVMSDESIASALRELKGESRSKQLASVGAV